MLYDNFHRGLSRACSSTRVSTWMATPLLTTVCVCVRGAGGCAAIRLSLRLRGRTMSGGRPKSTLSFCSSASCSSWQWQWQQHGRSTNMTLQSLYLTLHWSVARYVSPLLSPLFSEIAEFHSTPKIGMCADSDVLKI